MFSSKKGSDPIDPELKKYLDLLKEAPKRDPKAATQGRRRYLSEIDHLFGNQVNNSRYPWVRNRNLQPRGFFPRLTWSFAITSLITIAFIILLAGSAVYTASAAQAALPGDGLYPLKTRLEEGQAKFASSPERKVALHLQFAQQRVGEVQKLIDEKRYTDIPVAAQEYQAQIGNALTALKSVAVNHPDQATELVAKISSQLSQNSQSLSTLAVNVPEQVRGDFEKALTVSQIGGNEALNNNGQYEISGLIQQIDSNSLLVYGRTIQIDPQTVTSDGLGVGGFVKVNAFRDDNGNLVASAITPVESLDLDHLVNPPDPVALNDRTKTGTDRSSLSSEQQTGQNENDDSNQDNNDNYRSNNNVGEGQLVNQNVNANSNDNGANLNANSNANSNDNNGNWNQNSSANSNDDNGNWNQNSNANLNGNDANLNMNSNANSNDNNGNWNQNSNANSNGNDENLNANSNANSNGNDQNLNTNSNANSNDNGGNQNANSNANSNDNGGNGNVNSNANNNENDGRGNGNQNSSSHWNANSHRNANNKPHR